eukprot:750_1
MPAFSKLKCVDETSKNIMFGYIRNIEKIYNAPLAVKHLCLLYYFETEEFGAHSEKLVISSSSKTKHNDIVHQIDRTFWNSVFGLVVISSDNNPNAIYCWSFKVTFNAPTYHTTAPSIGIVSDTKAIDDYCFSDRDREDEYHYYGWETTWKEIRSNNVDITTKHPFGDYPKIKSGDILKMEVNLKNKSIKHFYNDKDLGIAFNNIDLNYKYYLGISFADQDRVQIVDFKIKRDIS